jgi:ribonuclease P protein component
MTPPETQAAGPEAGAAHGTSAVCACPAPVERLRRRADFLRAARAERQGTPGFLIQARRRGSDEATDAACIRVGFTCSRKVGNAVARNRARRRLREAARQVLPVRGRPGWDYVLVGRHGTTEARPFDRLVADLGWALAKLHKTH